MPKRIDLSGKRFGMLLVSSFKGINSTKNALWECICDCGNIKIVEGIKLRLQKTKSCGCLRKKVSAKRMTTHGLGKNKLNAIWQGIKQRCNNSSSKSHVNYGSRGIRLCNEWNSFLAFSDWAYKNGYRDGLTIERVNVNGNYDPSNCKWIPSKDQGKNKRNTIKVQGTSLLDFCKINDLPYKRIHERIKLGWTLKNAIETPNKRKPIYFEGLRLSEYCKIHNLNYSAIHAKYKSSGDSLENIIALFRSKILS